MHMYLSNYKADKNIKIFKNISMFNNLVDEFKICTAKSVVIIMTGRPELKNNKCQ